MNRYLLVFRKWKGINPPQFSKRFPTLIRNSLVQRTFSSSSSPKEEQTSNQSTDYEDLSAAEDRHIFHEFENHSKAFHRQLDYSFMKRGRVANFERIVNSLKKDNIYVGNLYLYTLNPLLEKYGFDLKEFSLGTKTYAFPTINSYIAKLLDAANSDPSEIEEISKELKNCVGDSLWNKIDTLRRNKEFAARFVKQVEDTNIESMRLYELCTRLVSESSKKEDLRRYKIGSVIVTMKIFFFTTQGDKDSNSRLNTEIWTFEGDISNRTPLNWIVVNIVGPRVSKLADLFIFRVVAPHEAKFFLMIDKATEHLSDINYKSPFV